MAGSLANTAWGYRSCPVRVYHRKCLVQPRYQSSDLLVEHRALLEVVFLLERPPAWLSRSAMRSAAWGLPPLPLFFFTDARPGFAYSSSSPSYPSEVFLQEMFSYSFHLDVCFLEVSVDTVYELSI